MFEALGTLGKPSIVAANGHVLAGSLGIALACDLIIARDGVGFGTPEINVGLFPFMIMALIYRNVPRKKATEMMLLGERLTTEEAREAGIVNRIVPADEFDAAVADWAAKLASKSPLVMKLGKDAIWRQLDMPLMDALDYLRAQLTIELSTEDAVEGVMAFFEKRDPNGRAADGRPDEPRLRALTDDLHARRDEGEARRGRGEDPKAARRGQADRARADRPARRRGHLRRDGHPRRPALLAALDGGQGRARGRRRHRMGRRRRPPLRDRRL